MHPYPPTLPSSSPLHSYGTRIKHNVPIKPAPRLRNSPDPSHRKLASNLGPSNSHIAPTPHNPNPNSYPHFPPDGVVLHPDDANSKVFLAIARSFLSVDNRAMTIKDLAEMSVHFGLVCQNVSAASQAITSYIRSHMTRCQVEQDCPLLLKHVLSGTPSDDDLLPALYSRSGGAHCPPIENRLTNFRRGTTVWYLGRATGAPCPFARAGIRLCDYTESGKVDPWDNGSHLDKRQRDKHHRWDLLPACGQKRKRPLRGCVARNAKSDSEDDSLDEQPPPKVKLTLRLNLAKVRSSQTPMDTSKDSDLSPLEDDEDEDDSMSVDSSEEETKVKEEKEEPWSLPPYPRRSISIPCYTPSEEGPYPSYFPSPSDNTFKDPFRRSPSIACSVGSLPPDSDEDDFHATRRRASIDEYGWDADLESEEDEDEDDDEDETFESPGPRSPSAPIVPYMPEINVKQEPKDVQGIIDEWDDLDSSVAGARVIAEALARAAAQVLDTEGLGKVKTESSWDWDPTRGLSYPSEWGTPFEEVPVKEEDLSLDHLFTSTHFPSAPSPRSSSSSLPYPDSRSPHSFGPEDDVPNTASSSGTIRPRARTVPSASSCFSDPASSSMTRPSISTSSGLDSITIPPPLSATSTLVSLIQSLSVHSPTTSSPPAPFSFPNTPLSYPAPPQDPRCAPSPDAVVVHTCQPCDPPISATQIEDISVYQMMLGENLVLRRIDTDFVNLSPIVAFSGAPPSVLNTVSNAAVITKGSPVVSGTWVPLSAAQAHVRDHPLPGGLLDVFLSDTLYERFPTALQDFHRTNSHGRALNQFGRHFTSTLKATHVVNGGDRSTFSVSMPFALSAAFGAERHNQEGEPPLSAQEQELFHELCVIPDWDKEVPTISETISMEADEAAKIVDEKVLEVSCSEPTPTENVSTESPPLSPLSSIDGFASEPSSPPASSTPVPPWKDVSVLDRSVRPLRRSKRVADAMAQTQARTGSRRGTSRNSLS